MSVLDGYNKYKRYIKTNDGYKLCSQWTSSNTVQMDDGNTLQTNLGAINGITDSLTATSSNIAASAAAVKTLNDNLTSHNHDSRYYTESEIDTKLSEKQNLLTNPIKTFSVTGSSVVNLSSYNGRMCYISFSVDSNSYLLCGGWFRVNANVYETFAGVQANSSTPISAAIQNTGNSNYKLCNAFWGGNDKTSSTKYSIRVF